MRYLLDTHTLLWASGARERLGAEARRTLDDDTQVLMLSAASYWELSLKCGLGKLKVDLDEIDLDLRQNGIEWLPISREHCRLVAQLPHHHRDPFDRLLIAQALHENLVVIGLDGAFDTYGVTRIW